MDDFCKYPFLFDGLHVFEFSTKPERSRTFIVAFPRGHIVFVVLLFKRLFIHCIADENLHTAILCDRNHIHLIKHVRQDVIDVFHITDNVIPCPTPQTNILVVGIRDIDVHLLVVARYCKDFTKFHSCYSSLL